MASSLAHQYSLTPTLTLCRFFFANLLQFRLIRLVQPLEAGMAREVRAKPSIFMGKGHGPGEIGRKDKVIGEG